MKKRSGFVSNSSSSSFIIGIGKVTDLAKAMQVIEKFNKANPYDDVPQIKSLSEIVEQGGKWDVPRLERNSLVVDSFNDDEVSLPVDLATDQNSLYFFVDITNNEGDSAEGSDFYNAVYEGGRIDEDYFSEPQSALFGLNEEEHGIKDYHVHFGAARNG